VTGRERIGLFFVVLVMGGCDSPSVSMMGGRVQEVSVDASRFRVFMQPGGNAVEAHRVSFEALPSLVVTLERGYRAIEMATGCRVVAGSLGGDRAIVLAQVDCAL
jgi:hypothetical protein